MITKLRSTAAAIAVALLATASCAREQPHRQDTFVARRLGESTASPGSDPNRPVARSIDTQEVSATISPSSPIAKPGAAPVAPAAPIAQRPQAPAPVAPPPQPTQQPTQPPAAPPSASDVGSPGVFAPPPAPPQPTAPTPTTPITTTPITPTPPRP